MKFIILKETLKRIVDELCLNSDIEKTILEELNGKNCNPSNDLDQLHAKIKENNLNDKIVKSILYQNQNDIEQLCGYAAILDYYLIFLGFSIPIIGIDLNSDTKILDYYKKRIHQTNYGRIIIKHKYESTYLFKTKVAQVSENWLFEKWFGKDITNENVILLRKNISVIKNARLIIDISVLKKIFEFNLKDFTYNKEVLDFIRYYNFEITQFEKELTKNIEFLGCEYRKRLDDCYELIFS